MDDSSVSVTSVSLLQQITENIQRLRVEIAASIPPNQLALPQIKDLIDNLPRLTEQQVTKIGHRDSLCPICLNPLLAILAEEETAIAMDSPAHPIEDLGVTILSQTWQCGHIFCRRDISQWIKEAHDSCPMCRHLLVQPSSESADQGTRLAEPSLDTDDNPFGDLERQINLLHTFVGPYGYLAGPPGSFPDLGRISSNGDENGGDTNEHSGMYS